MKTFMTLLAAVFLSLALTSVPADAARDYGKDKKGMMEHEMMYKDYMGEMMKMQKETMEILHGLNHKPTDAEKARLDKMIQNTEKMMKEHNKKMKEMKMKDKKMMMDDDNGM